MRNLIDYIKEENEFNVDGFKIINKKDETIVSVFGEGELIKALHELKQLKEQDPSIEYWIIGTINNGYYDLEDGGNYRVITSREYNDKDEYYGINPKYNKYLRQQ